MTNHDPARWSHAQTNADRALRGLEHVPFDPALHGITKDEIPFPMSADDYGMEQPAAPQLPTQAAFKLIALDEVTVAQEPAWAIWRLLPARGLACIIGAPKCGKSFLATDALFAVADGIQYAGRDTLQGPVVYATGEGVSGFRRRLIALRKHRAAEGSNVPFLMLENVPDLGSERTNVAKFIQDIEADIKRRQLPRPRAIALDTLARCMGAGDENAAKDMGRFIDRCGQIERHFGCVVLVIHHVGKDEKKKGRGSNALNGAADVTWEVKKLASHSRVRIEEMKDGAEGVTWTFRLVPFVVDGPQSATFSEVAGASENTTCVVEIVNQPTQAQLSATSDRKRTPSGVAGDLLKVIRRAIDETGETTLAGQLAPAGTRAVDRDNLRRYCETMAWQSEAKNKRSVLSNNLSKLREAGLIDFDRHAVWSAAG